MTQFKWPQRLLELPLVGNMPDDAKKRIGDLFLRVSEVVSLDDGEILLREGDLGGRFGFVLVQGSAEVDKEGKPTIDLPAPALMGEMQQFNPRALRTATVRAKGKATALKFLWQEFYSQAKDDLSLAEQTMLMDSIERIVWERFDRETLMELGLFQGLPEQLRLRACMILQWVAQPVAPTDGQILFKKGEMCGAIGYLLTQGTVELAVSHQAARTVQAPDILGVTPHFDPNLQWTATATAVGALELLKFSWLTYGAMLEERLSLEEVQRLGEAFEASAGRHFAH